MSVNIVKSAEIIRENCGALKPRLAVVLGSGLGAVANLLDETASIPYTALPGFPRPTVAGHEGLLRIGTVAGAPVIFLKGRVHLYEGGGADPLKTIVRTLKTAGVDTLFLTNAAGSLDPQYPPGSLVAVKDHLNLLGTNPLVGHNDDEWGPRFPPMDNCWDGDLRARLVKTAKAENIPLGQGVLAGLLGPSFETHAEIRMLKVLGADTVGMSMVAENIVARHCGLRCVGVSAITNLAAGLGDEQLSHAHTLAGAKLAEEKMAALVRVFIRDFSKNS